MSIYIFYTSIQQDKHKIMHTHRAFMFKLCHANVIIGYRISIRYYN